MIDHPDDIFFLTLDELRENTVALPTRVDRCPVVEARRSEMAHFRDITPPAMLGTPPASLPPDTSLGRALQQVFGLPPRSTAEPNTLTGAAGAPGIARGPARVIRSLAEAESIHKGDVLVAESTNPSWTPLFAILAAVVTDHGGVLTHCAIVAREYGLPEVVGTGSATRRVRDGQLLEVDGSTGTVRLLEPG